MVFIFMFYHLYIDLYVRTVLISEWHHQVILTTAPVSCNRSASNVPRQSFLSTSWPLGFHAVPGHGRTRRNHRTYELQYSLLLALQNARSRSSNKLSNPATCIVYIYICKYPRYIILVSDRPYTPRTGYFWRGWGDLSPYSRSGWLRIR